MSVTDFIVGSAIGAAESKLQGEEPKKKTSIGGAILRFFISTIWVLITLIVSIGAAVAMVAGQTAGFMGSEKGLGICIAAIAVCLIFALITFLIPYLRKKGTMTRWCGIVLLGDAIWWIYLIATN